MKNYCTPRTLADTTFTTGYGISKHPRSMMPSRTERIAGVVLACLIGIFGALLIVHELAGLL